MKHWLYFEEVYIPGRKTKFWVVRNVQTREVLGSVHWKASWRKYALFTKDVIFDSNCLREVVEFVDKAMTEHCADREKARKARF